MMQYYIPSIHPAIEDVTIAYYPGVFAADLCFIQCLDAVAASKPKVMSYARMEFWILSSLLVIESVCAQ